jgi:putative transposase
MINRKHDLALVQQCKALKLHRTTIYREAKPVNQDQLDLMKLIDRIPLDDPAWGCRKVREYLIGLGHPIGRRHCTMLYRKLGIHCIYRKLRTTIPHIGHKAYPYLLRYMEIVKPNHVWAMDITYNPMAQCFVFLTCVMDVYSRNILSSVISNTLDARFCVEAYEEAVSLYGSPEIMNTIRGRSLHPLRLSQQLLNGGSTDTSRDTTRSAHTHLWAVKHRTRFTEQNKQISCSRHHRKTDQYTYF